ncbi:MAG TPA: putative PEP-binding protein, partial [Gemmatimonadales bacterium]|nr:putative PEP-binding protein [Gemmatimonadales bacterium]
DGQRVEVAANIGGLADAQKALASGAEGVGLLRTEFLLTGRAVLPTEQEQADYFKRVAVAFAGHPIVIRSYDLGGDKFPAAFRMPQEANPFLGWRSIRVCLDQPEIFRPQLRALLRAAFDRPIQLLLPLVTRVEEVEQSRALLAEEAAALEREGVRAAKTLPVGVMIETPAAVLIADTLAEVCDFFSVGTNDLTQYTLAVDRGNARLADRFTPFHPAIIRQLAAVLEAAKARDLPVSICGEMASEPLSVVLLLGLGYRTFSVAPPSIPLVKWVLRSLPVASAQAAAEAARAARSSEEVTRALRDALAPHVDLRLIDPHTSLPGGGQGVSLPSDSPAH